jgi:hypothetical protein
VGPLTGPSARDGPVSIVVLLTATTAIVRIIAVLDVRSTQRDHDAPHAKVTFETESA